MRPLRRPNRGKAERVVILIDWRPGRSPEDLAALFPDQEPLAFAHFCEVSARNPLLLSLEGGISQILLVSREQLSTVMATEWRWIVRMVDGQHFLYEVLWPECDGWDGPPPASFNVTAWSWHFPEQVCIACNLLEPSSDTVLQIYYGDEKREGRMCLDCSELRRALVTTCALSHHWLIAPTSREDDNVGVLVCDACGINISPQ